MSTAPLLQSPSPTRIVATGFTTAFLGDERTLREFIIGDAVTSQIEQDGGSAVLYLFNDSYDPLNYRQLRVAVHKDEGLLRRFEPYCGRPISEIPDPFECHEHYAHHFEKALIHRLARLGIQPFVVDSYKAYQVGRYTDLIAKTFRSYEAMQQGLSSTFGAHMAADLFRVQCLRCRRLDDTHIEWVRDSVVRSTCGACRTTVQQDVAEVKGKFSWKVECAARWNLYGVDVEVFSKAHLAELGSVPVARFLSEVFFGARKPDVVPYGDVTISPDLSGKLLDVLPPPILRALFAAHPKRDLHLTREGVEGFCRTYPVGKGLSYWDYVRRELPFHALCDTRLVKSTAVGSQAIGAEDLMAYGNRFSMCFYAKDYRLTPPSDATLSASDGTVLSVAHRVIQYALSIREGCGADWNQIKSQIKSYLAGQELPKHLYRYLRTAFGQTEGPNVTTLLAVLPERYLRAIATRLKERLTQDRLRAA
jgi:hypothetical protein